MKLSKRTSKIIIRVLIAAVVIVAGTLLVQKFYPTTKPVVSAAQMQENKHIALSLYAHAKQGITLTESLISESKDQQLVSLAKTVKAELETQGSKLEIWFSDNNYVVGASWSIEKTLQIPHYELQRATKSSTMAKSALKHFSVLTEKLNMKTFTQDTDLISVANAYEALSAEITAQLQ